MGKKKLIDGYEYESYSKETYSEKEIIKRSEQFFEWMDKRRTVREFSDKPIPRKVIDNILKSASTALSLADKQPWSFCVITNSDLKKKIRAAAEKEEYNSYHGRMSEEWVKDLKPLGTDWNKPFLEMAPYLIVIFKKPYNLDMEGKKHNNYYVNESVGLAAGFLLTAIHDAGLVALTHTPSPMNFLSKLLGRPENERPFLLIPIGYPLDETYVPCIKRKPLEETVTYYD